MKKLTALVLALAMMLTCVSALAADYVIGTDNPFKPFEWIDENGALVGFDVDLMEAVAADQGFTVEWQPVGWDSAIAGCQSGQYDGMIAGASITDERKANGWIFSDGYFSASQSFAVAAGSAVATLEDLKGMIVVTKIGTESNTYAMSIAETYGFTVFTVEDDATMYQAVAGGQADACVNDTPILNANIAAGVPLQILENSANEGAQYGFAVFSPDHQDLVDKFNAGLATVVENGTYDELIAKYFN